MSALSTALAPSPPLSGSAFARIQRFLYDTAGIHLAPNKQEMVAGRLQRRLRLRDCPTFDAYVALIESGNDPHERQTALDLLTTNETYFFREPRHFEFLAELARQSRGMRVWSAACSSGEEPYSIAMILAETLGDAPWEVLGSDISTRVLARAERGHYPLDRLQDLGSERLRRHCLRGVREQDGTMLVDGALRSRVHFRHLNLMAPLPEIGQFDVIFLRNVMIYFDQSAKERVLSQLAHRLKPGGHLFIGHSESLSGVTNAFASVRPAIYRRP